jgi:hypothetical protein
MKQELADFIIEACQNNDCLFDGEDMPELRQNYSGRGMFGRETTAIVCENIMTVMAAIMCELNYSAEEWTIDFEDIRFLRTDSMGRDSIIIY